MLLQASLMQSAPKTSAASSPRTRPRIGRGLWAAAAEASLPAPNSTDAGLVRRRVALAWTRAQSLNNCDVSSGERGPDGAPSQSEKAKAQRPCSRGSCRGAWARAVLCRCEPSHRRLAPPSRRLRYPLGASRAPSHGPPLLRGPPSTRASSKLSLIHI